MPGDEGEARERTDRDQPSDDAAFWFDRLRRADTGPPTFFDSRWWDVVLWLTVAFFAARLTVRLVTEGQILVIPAVFVVTGLVNLWIRRRRRGVPWRY